MAYCQGGPDSSAGTQAYKADTSVMGAIVESMSFMARRLLSLACEFPGTERADARGDNLNTLELGRPHSCDVCAGDREQRSDVCAGDREQRTE